MHFKEQCILRVNNALNKEKQYILRRKNEFILRVTMYFKRETMHFKDKQWILKRNIAFYE
jgi:hypothetical protein